MEFPVTLEKMLLFLSQDSLSEDSLSQDNWVLTMWFCFINFMFQFCIIKLYNRTVQTCEYDSNYRRTSTEDEEPRGVVKNITLELWMTAVFNADNEYSLANHTALNFNTEWLIMARIRLACFAASGMLEFILLGETSKLCGAKRTCAAVTACSHWTMESNYASAASATKYRSVVALLFHWVHWHQLTLRCNVAAMFLLCFTACHDVLLLL